MMELIIEYARREGLQEIEGEVLADNEAKLHMCGKFGFFITALTTLISAMSA